MAEQTTSGSKAAAAAAGAGLILFTLSAGQFLMTLDTSVMNVSIATVAKDVGTTVTGVQTAITLYTLVMASLMVLGGKIGSIIGRKRAFSIGCIIYGCGSMTTALAPNLTVLIIGWSFLEGIGAVLIMPAIVGLVAGNFPPAARPKAYGLIAAAAAIAVAVGPVIGGFMTTYFSWRYVFAGEVVIVLGILLLARRIHDAPPPERRPQLDLVGAALSALGLGLIVFGVLRSSEWGWVKPKPGGMSWLGVAPTVWLLIVGGLVLYLFMHWEMRLEERHAEPLVTPSLLKNHQLVAGLTTFFFQSLLLAGVFFVVPLFLSVALGLTALETGVRILPLSVALLVAAIGIPRLWPLASPRRFVRVGLLFVLGGSSCSSPASTSTPQPRSSPSRCCCSASESGRWPRSSERSPSRPYPTTTPPRWAACRTRPPTWAPRWARRSPARCSSPCSRRPSSSASSRTRRSRNR